MVVVSYKDLVYIAACVNLFQLLFLLIVLLSLFFLMYLSLLLLYWLLLFVEFFENHNSSHSMNTLVECEFDFTCCMDEWEHAVGGEFARTNTVVETNGCRIGQQQSIVLKGEMGHDRDVADILLSENRLG